jgi:hypothetical protein
VDTKQEHVIIDALKMNLEFASGQIDVSIWFLFQVPFFLLTLTPFHFQQLIKHSQSKDQYIRVALKRLTKMHYVDNEPTKEKALNQALLARNEELESQLATKVQEKTDKSIVNIDFTIPKILLD